MYLIEYCKTIVLEGNHDREQIANLIMNGVESVNEGEQRMAWNLLRQAGMPFYERAAFLAAADLAIELVNEDEPPRAA